jgi:hypothetical protein
MRVPITVAAETKAWNAFALPNAGIVGSNPTQGTESGWSPNQGVLPTS